MNELTIDYGLSKSKKLTNTIIGSYLAAFALYFCISEGVNSRFSFLFFSAMVGFVLAAIQILSNTLWATPPIFKMDHETISTEKPERTVIEWATVNQVNIGINYIIFLVDSSPKKHKIDLSLFKYEDIKAIKSETIEICEYKKITYQNDK